jgi:2-dehydro-3-deoxygluconokinase
VNAADPAHRTTVPLVIHPSDGETKSSLSDVRMPPPTVVTLGEAMLRLSAPPGRRLRASRVLETFVAGAEANVAAALAYLGVPTAWVSAVPDSPLGRRVLDELALAGVRLDGVQLVGEGRLGIFFAECGADPRPTQVWYDRSGSAFTTLERFDERLLVGARYAVVSGITPALGDGSAKLAVDFAVTALDHGVQLCVDVNYRARLWAPSAARTVIGQLLTYAQVVVCSERDARTVFDCSGSDSELLLEFAEQRAPRASLVVLTQADRGSRLLDRSTGAISAQAAVPTQVVDPFGAGDAFMAGLIWVWGANIRVALQVGGLRLLE